MKNFTYLLVFLLATCFSYGQTTLGAGDIAITGVHSDNPDSFSFVLLTDVVSGTAINFTDLGWESSSGSFYTTVNEGVVTWTAASNLTCGTEIIITDAGGNTYSATSGTAVESDAGFAFATTGESLSAYQGDLSTPVLLAAAFFGSASGWTNATNANTSAVPSGLTDGTNAINMGNFDNGAYNCSTTSDATLILADAVDPSNWTLENFGPSRPTLGTCTFTSCAATCSSPTVTWTAGAWSPITGPNVNTPVIIADNYDTATDGTFTACSLTINTGFNLTVSDGDFVEIENDVTVDGQLFVTSEGNFVQNNDLASFTDNSTNGVQVTKTKTFPRKFAYTYWSSPVVGETIEQTFGTVQADRRFYFEAANFVDVLAEVNNTGTFNAGSDDIDDDGDDWQIASGTMASGAGYAAVASQFGPAFPRSENFVFSGAFNNGIVNVWLVNNSGGSYNDWNFVGNPYAGAISADRFFTVNSGLVNVIYLWDQFTAEDENASGNEGQNLSVADYAIINGTGETAGASGTIPIRFIGSGQGFFVEALAAGNLTFDNSMRDGAHNNTQFFKSGSTKSSTAEANKIWVNLTTDNGVFNQILVGYIDAATDADDGSGYDTKRIISSGNAALLYSMITGSDDKFVIQGKHSSSIDENEIIPIGFMTTIDDTSRQYTLSIAQLQGDFLNTNTVFLKDNLSNVTHNLSDSDYVFTSEAGTFNDRFEIGFNASALSSDEFETSSNALKIVQLNANDVQFSTTTSEIKSVTIFDLLGRQLYDLEGNSSSEVYNLSNLKNSIYIAKIALANGTVITKKAIKK